MPRRERSTRENRAVEFPPSGGAAYRPRQMLIRVAEAPAATASHAIDELSRRFGRGADESGDPVAGYQPVSGDFPVLPAVGVLRAAGVTAQPNHMLFAGSSWAAGTPQGFSGNPFSSNPFSSNPFSSNPFSSNPFSSNPFSSNPFSSNPFSSNPFSSNPFPGAVYGNPGMRRRAGQRFAEHRGERNLARPTDPIETGDLRPSPGGTPVVAVLDVSLPSGASGLRPAFLDDVRAVVTTGGSDAGRPDLNGDRFLDRAAGHGLFVAGRVALVHPGCSLVVVEVLDNDGDGDEATVARQLGSLAGQVDIVNLSFGGYSMTDMGALATAVAEVQATPGPASRGLERDVPAEDHGAVVVASAGNDGTWLAPYPAALPDVVSVGALGPYGPAPFTNYGPWVRACASGVDVRSTFFRGVDAAELPEPGGDPDEFDGAATWSGTSFAAPLVAGRIARAVAQDGLLPKEAVRMLVDAPDLARIPGLGAIVTA